ncbi:ComEA family DNA-binding protein [Aggregatibacter kilianii]|uniref:ComEA family DNA-binding protein n=1 Tax=Aggregatibacter kilianii TaxID=2025884 RepID=UPI000D65C12E|nr:helix-hairpin-helix domain-containing protein [Aggregatibacter kilianii]
MKAMKHLLASLFVLGSVFAGSAVAAEKTAEPTVQTEQPAATAAVGDKVNINTATAAEIQKALVGIGAKKAEAVVQYREKHGAFSAVEQLLEVQGIGKATLEKNRDRIAL